MESKKTQNEKRTELTLYIADRLKDRSCGSVKLNKILFFCDIVAYGSLGRSITGAKYTRQPMGPVPGDMVELRKHLKKTAQALVVPMKAGGGKHTEHRLVPLRSPRKEVFSAEELKIVDNLTAQLGQMTGKQLSEISHRFGGWQLARTGEHIPMATIFVPAKPPKPTPQQLAWANSVLDDLAA